jgi:subtilisin family serine protease
VAVVGNLAPDNRIVVDFIGRYLHQNVPLLVPIPALTGGVSPRVNIVRGAEFDEDAINQRLTAPDPQFHRDTEGHGSHVAGIAAGDGSQAGNCHGGDYYIGVAPEADIIAVKTTFDSDDTSRGVAYIFDQARAATKAAVVNLSLGGSRGARDGSAASEQFLDRQLVDAATGNPIPGRAIVVSSGNDGGLYDHAHPERDTSTYSGGRHSFKQLSPGQANVPVNVVVDANDRLLDEIDVWYSGAGRIQFNITSPAPGSASLPAPVSPGGASGPFVVAGHNISVFSVLNATPNKHEILVQITPPAGGLIAAGTWVIQLTETANVATDVDLWIPVERNDRFARFALADQVRTRTLTVPSTAQRVICVGAYNPRDSTLAEFSSRGPVTDAPGPNPRIKPDLCAPGVGIIAPLAGARPGACCDCCVDFYKPDDGTSMAAPHVTGIVALIFQRNRNLTFEQVREHLRASGRAPDPITGPTLPNSTWGTGKVDAEVTVAGVPPSARVEQPGPIAPVRAVPDDEPLILPAAAYAAAYLPTAARVRELEGRIGGSATGQLAAALVSTHVDEVLRLINTNRRVAVAWHRMHGPVLLRLALGTQLEGGPLLPRTIGGTSVVAGLQRLLDELARCGSPALRADIARYGAFAVALVGTPLAELDRISEAG